MMTMVMIMLMTRDGGGERRRSAQGHDKRACIKIFQKSSLSVGVRPLITNPPIAFYQFSVWKCFWLFACSKIVTHPQHADLCVHSVLFSSLNRFRVFLFLFSLMTNSRDSIRVNGKTTSTLLCTCDRRGCTENREFELMEIEPLGPPPRATVSTHCDVNDASLHCRRCKMQS